MQKMLNEDFIDSYCEKFAAKVTESFFSEEKITISGKEILEVTPSKQTNFFVIKLLFRYWQGETKKLESPFFNYEQEEVQEALTEFMNILSQHIEVHKNGFQMLLNHAVKDTLYLAAAPEAYIEIDLEDRRVDKIDEQVIAETLKYLRIYKKDIGNFLSDMRGLTIDDVIDELPEEFEEFDSKKGLEKESALLSAIVPIKPDQVLTDKVPDEFYEDDEETFDNDDFFSPREALAGDEPAKSEAPKEAPIPKDMKWEDEPAQDFEAIEEEPKKQEEKEVRPLEDTMNEGGFVGAEERFIKEEANFNVADSEAEEIFLKTIAPKVKEEREEPKVEETASEQPVEDVPEEEIIKQKEEKQTETINDQFEVPEKTVVEHHEETKSGSMMELISVNHQFMFVKELFKDDKISFQNALNDLEDYNTFDDAVEFLVQGYAKEFGWDMQSTEVKELLKVLFRKFRG